MTDATATRDRAPKRLAYWSLLACTTAVGAVTFVLSFVGLRDFAERVAGFPDHLAWLVPVGVDGLTLCAVAATMILRHAPWGPRLYAWTAFGIAVAASVAGNLSHADARKLSWEGHVGAAAWPIFLALASHMVIVVRRNMERSGRREPVAATTATATSNGRAPTKSLTPPVVVAAPPIPAPPVADAPVAQRRPSKNMRRASKATRAETNKADAVRRVAAGESPAKVALSLGVHKATVYRWRDEAAARDSQEPADDTKEGSRELVAAGA